jgi:uncharacterized damage-inducible protein DinB
MFSADIALLYERDIQKIKNEMLAYPHQDKRWELVPGISNSGGNLCLHLLGNLQHYIGAVLGKSGYIRNRPEEFSLKNIPETELVATIDRTLLIVSQTIRALYTDILVTLYPEKVFDYDMTVQYFLLHLLAHLSYHLGQINYHRRIVSA